MNKDKEQTNVRMCVGATHADRKYWWTQGRGSYNTALINRISEIKRNYYDNTKNQGTSK